MTKKHQKSRSRNRHHDSTSKRQTFKLQELNTNVEKYLRVTYCNRYNINIVLVCRDKISAHIKKTFDKFMIYDKLRAPNVRGIRPKSMANFKLKTQKQLDKISQWQFDKIKNLEKQFQLQPSYFIQSSQSYKNVTVEYCELQLPRIMLTYAIVEMPLLANIFVKDDKWDILYSLDMQCKFDTLRINLLNECNFILNKILKRIETLIFQELRINGSDNLNDSYEFNRLLIKAHAFMNVINDLMYFFFEDSENLNLSQFKEKFSESSQIFSQNTLSEHDSNCLIHLRFYNIYLKFYKLLRLIESLSLSHDIQSQQHLFHSFNNNPNDIYTILNNLGKK